MDTKSMRQFSTDYFSNHALKFKFCYACFFLSLLPKNERKRKSVISITATLIYKYTLIKYEIIISKYFLKIENKKADLRNKMYLVYEI